MRDGISSVANLGWSRSRSRGDTEIAVTNRKSPCRGTDRGVGRVAPSSAVATISTQKGLGFKLSRVKKFCSVAL
ncbi:MAG: hypothetical protein RSC11_07570, partial [Mucinivorans sp.]